MGKLEKVIASLVIIFITTLELAKIMLLKADFNIDANFVNLMDLIIKVLLIGTIVTLFLKDKKGRLESQKVRLKDEVNSRSLFILLFCICIINIIYVSLFSFTNVIQYFGIQKIVENISFINYIEMSFGLINILILIMFIALTIVTLKKDDKKISLRFLLTTVAAIIAYIVVYIMSVVLGVEYFPFKLNIYDMVILISFILIAKDNVLAYPIIIFFSIIRVIYVIFIFILDLLSNYWGSITYSIIFNLGTIIFLIYIIVYSIKNIYIKLID